MEDKTLICQDCGCEFTFTAGEQEFYKEKGFYRLQPENDSMDPIIVDDVQILGKVCGVFRIFL